MNPRSLRHALALMLVATPVVAAPDNADKVLRCNLDSNISCSGDKCERTAEEYPHLVDLALSPSENGGNLCTGTYCRAFEWLPVMGDQSGRRTFGPILSESSGSTEDERDIPMVDYHLWISADRARFALLPLEKPEAAWAGSCSYLH